MSKTNQRRNELLEMPFGTASHKLRKQILFKLLQKYNEDVCCICNTKINTIKELTIEHKISWLNSDNPQYYFWNLDNIGFAHAQCNRPTTLNINKDVRKVPLNEENSICFECKEEKHKSNFYSRKDRWNNVDFRCKNCAKKSVSKSRKNKIAL